MEEPLDIVPVLGTSSPSAKNSRAQSPNPVSCTAETGVTSVTRVPYKRKRIDNAVPTLLPSELSPIPSAAPSPVLSPPLPRAQSPNPVAVLFTNGTKVTVKQSSKLYETKKDAVGVQVGEKQGVQNSKTGCSIVVHWEGFMEADVALISTRELKVVPQPRVRSPTPSRARSPASPKPPGATPRARSPG